MVSLAPLGAILIQLLPIVRQAVSFWLKLLGALIERRERTLSRRLKSVFCLEFRLEFHPVRSCFAEFLLLKIKNFG